MFVMYLIILNVLVVLVVEIFEKTKRQMRSKTTLCAQVSQIIALKRLSDEGGITLSDIKVSFFLSISLVVRPLNPCQYSSISALE